MLILFFAFLLSGLAVQFESPSALCFFISIACYAALEVLIGNSNHYNAGVDNALSFCCVAFCFAGCTLLFKDYSTVSLPNCFIAFLLCIYLAIRFTDAFMSVLAFLFLLASAVSLFGHLSIAILEPFVLMAVCAFVYFAVQKQKTKFWLFPYFKSFSALSFISALCFYAAGNYYAISILSGYMNFHVVAKVELPIGWFFWTWTMLMPLIYLAVGIIRKNALFLRMGLALVIVALLTFRHYYSVMPAEIALILGGIISIIASYALIRYLKRPRHGFTFDEAVRRSEGTALSHELIKNTLMNKTTAHAQIHDNRDSADY